MRVTKFFLIATFALCGVARAQLSWDNRSIELRPSPADSIAVAVFSFTNTGRKPVKIDDVSTSCGCTTASLDKRIYARGEKGNIAAIFDIASQLGVQEKSIYVKSTDPKEPNVTLHLKVVIPESIWTAVQLTGPQAKAESGPLP
jgi:hypothetical protein